MSLRIATKRSLEHLGSEQDAKKAKENEGDDVHTAAPKAKVRCTLAWGLGPSRHYTLLQ
jgi:hypothetical protein